ncbi:selenophosphate synthetase [Nonlabens xiamenensis]|uniref:selenophosphate synthetase n=1 Tax=Nonlabens xiamenensis TaxID=2341043 RepID=UPI000F60EB9C|nr:selenophosphate synthetase [Nonlabens xiamenensis]
MRILCCILTLGLLLSSCKQDKKAPQEVAPTESREPSEASQKSNSTEEPDITTKAGLVAQQAGIEQWKQVEQVQFTFNVEKGGKNLVSRQWTWNPKSDMVQLISKGETVNFNRRSLNDTITKSADRSFVNDVYWLLPQFKLVWDTGTKITYPTEDLVRIAYVGDGGYTPGDRYDLRLNDQNRITQWEYYPQGSDSPTMTTTFEDYKTFNGIEIAQQHKAVDGDLNIYFTDINILKNKQ